MHGIDLILRLRLTPADAIPLLFFLSVFRRSPRPFQMPTLHLFQLTQNSLTLLELSKATSHPSLHLFRGGSQGARKEVSVGRRRLDTPGFVV